MYSRIQTALDDGQEVLLTFCDVSKAFDRVWHRGLLHKLKKVGIKGKLLAWLEHYLKKRRHRVVVNGQSSEDEEIDAGVPQGSILGPLLFILYMNDLVQELTLNLKLYADDVTLYIAYDHPIEAKVAMEEDLQKILNWANKWYITFNPTKTDCLCITRKRDHIPPEIYMGGTKVANSNSHKHLGVILQKDGKWGEQIDETSTKANRRIDILRSLGRKLDRSSLERLYISYIRPILEHGAQIRINCTEGEHTRLEMIQLAAARVVSGAKRGTSHRELYEEMGWATLRDRSESQCLTMLHKMVNNLAPETMKSLLPARTNQRNTYNIRVQDTITMPRTTSQAHYKSFLPSTIKLWNSLPSETRNIPSNEEFKRAVKTKIAPPPPTIPERDKRSTDPTMQAEGGKPRPERKPVCNQFSRVPSL
jgi:hypothetical protein